MALRLLDPTGQDPKSDAIQQVENNRKIEKLLNATDTSSLLQTAYPVGALYISTLATNPATLLGFGTWAAFGAGRTMVGLDSGQVEFDTVEETGGAKTVALATAELASHTHTFTGDAMSTHNHTQNSHNHGGATAGRTLEWKTTNTLGGSSTVVTDLEDLTGATAPDGTGAHTHVISSDTAVNVAGSAGTPTGTNANAGSGTAHQNLQPYIVCYFWKRTA